MLNKKILIAALTLALSASALASCGSNVGNESTSGTSDSATEAITTETENKNDSAPGSSSIGTTNTESGSVGTTNTESNSNSTSNTESSSTGTTNTESSSSGTTNTESGTIIGQIGNDVKNGANNVKRGVEDFFGDHNGMPRSRNDHRPPVPFGK